jgi:hypothetical protein
MGGYCAFLYAAHPTEAASIRVAMTMMSFRMRSSY